jgi:hypothetical protein
MLMHWHLLGSLDFDSFCKCYRLRAPVLLLFLEPKSRAHLMERIALRRPTICLAQISIHDLARLAQRQPTD